MTTRPVRDRAGVVLTWAPAPRDRIGRRRVAWDLVRGLLADVDASDATLDNPCARCGGPHGALIVTGAAWRASVAYAGGFAVAAIAPEGVEAFGVDAEPLTEPVRDRAGWAGTGADGVAGWVRTEASLKADGRGLRVDPGTVRIVPGAGEWVAHVPGRATPLIGWDAASAPPGLFVAVSVGAAPEGPAAPGHRATR